MTTLTTLNGDRIVIAEYNKNHDKAGRFTTGKGGLQTIIIDENTKKFGLFEDNGYPSHDASNYKDFIEPHSSGFPGKETLDTIAEWVDRDGCKATQASCRSGKDDGIVKSLDKITQSNSLKADTNLFRGIQMSQGELTKLAESKSFKSKTFFATGLNGTGVEAWFSNGAVWGDNKQNAQPILIRVKAKKGSSGYFADSRWPSPDYYFGVGEFIPSRNTTYIVRGAAMTVDKAGTYLGGIVDLEIK